MELTDTHLEVIKKSVQSIKFGKLTINISEDAKTLDLIVENRIKIKKEPDDNKMG